ncbi:MAG: hypothetical protein GX600_02735 [Dehalococcoidia bacterium]|nr:hypothetical protein [Dehalococcoidia bacterium]
MTLPALLQWLSPLAATDQDRLAEVYAEALREELLPQEEFFTIEDFHVFADMGWECRNLPQDDVEDCVRYIRKNFSHLDPSDPKDREKLQHQLSRFFADPARKFQTELAKAEQNVKESDEKAEEAEAKAREVQKRADELQAENRRLRLRAEAFPRIVLGVVLLIALLAVAAYLQLVWGDPKVNWFQRVTADWKLYTMAFALGGTVLVLLVGRERAAALGWPWNKWLKVD